MKSRKTPPRFIELLPVIVILLVGIAFMFEAVLYQFNLYKLKNGETTEYQGVYNVCKKEYIRNTNYIIKLDNGDSIEVPCEQINENQTFEDIGKASFRYLKYKRFFIQERCIGVSIDSMDKTVVFMQEQTAKTELVMGIIIGYILGIPCIIVSVLLLLSDTFVDMLLKKWKRRYRPRQKHKGRN